MHNVPSEWRIFKNTHEAIVDEVVFEIEQKICDERRRVTPMGEMPCFPGCCSAPTAARNCTKSVAVDGNTANNTSYAPPTSKSRVGSHQIRNVIIEEALLDDIRQVTAFAKDHDAEFMEMVTKKTTVALDKSLRDNKRELKQNTQRIRKLDEIIKRLYEDNLEGKTSDERFAKMTANHKAAQYTLE